MFIPPWRWPHKWPKHVGRYPAIKLHQNTIVYLLVFILYSFSASRYTHLIGLCSIKKDTVPSLALTLNKWQLSWMQKRISKMTFESRRSDKFTVSDTDLQILHYYFHWLHIWFISPNMNEVAISNTAGIVILTLRAKRQKLMLTYEN